MISYLFLSLAHAEAGIDHQVLPPTLDQKAINIPIAIEPRVSTPNPSAIFKSEQFNYSTPEIKRICPACLEPEYSTFPPKYAENVASNSAQTLSSDINLIFKNLKTLHNSSAILESKVKKMEQDINNISSKLDQIIKEIHDGRARQSN